MGGETVRNNGTDEGIPTPLPPSSNDIVKGTEANLDTVDASAGVSSRHLMGAFGIHLLQKCQVTAELKCIILTASDRIIDVLDVHGSVRRNINLIEITNKI